MRDKKVTFIVQAAVIAALYVDWLSACESADRRRDL